MGQHTTTYYKKAYKYYKRRYKKLSTLYNTQLGGGSASGLGQDSLTGLDQDSASGLGQDSASGLGQDPPTALGQDPNEVAGAYQTVTQPGLGQRSALLPTDSAMDLAQNVNRLKQIQSQKPDTIAQSEISKLENNSKDILTNMVSQYTDYENQVKSCMAKCHMRLPVCLSNNVRKTADSAHTLQKIYHRNLKQAGRVV